MSLLLSAQLTALQAKVHYLRYLSELRLFGGREFKSILLVSPFWSRKPCEKFESKCEFFLSFSLILICLFVLKSAARWETDRGDAVSRSTLRHQPRHQCPHKPGGPIGWLQPCESHWDPHWGWDQCPAGAACSGRQGESRAQLSLKTSLPPTPKNALH